MPQQTLNLKHVSLPSAWDAAELTRLRLADGTTYQQMVADIDGALEIAANMLLNSYYGRLISVTDEVAVEYDSGNVRGFERVTERGRGQGRRGDTSGHMLPLMDFDYQLYWTHLWLRDARRAQIDRQVNGLIANVENLFQKEALTRLFKMEEETGHYFGLGSGGVSVPFCDGGGGTIAYTPTPKPDRGGTFASTHDHYLRLNGITQANLETAVRHLWEHGIDGPYDLVISLADIASWTDTANVTGYVEKPDPSVVYGSGATLAQVEDIYIGGAKTEYGFCRMWASGRIPTAYWGVTKVYGQNDMRNPLKARVPTGQETISAELIVENVGSYPLQGAVPFIRFGVGVGEMREAAVLVENDSSGDYASPAIS